MLCSSPCPRHHATCHAVPPPPGFPHPPVLAWFGLVWAGIYTHTHTRSALLAASRLLAADEADCVANMGLLDDVYRAAGLQPRLPSAQAVARQAQQQQQQAAAASKAVQAAGSAAGQTAAGPTL